MTTTTKTPGYVWTEDEVRAMLREIKDLSGLAWAEVGDLFGVSSLRALEWATGDMPVPIEACPRLVRLHAGTLVLAGRPLPVEEDDDEPPPYWETMAWMLSDIRYVLGITWSDLAARLNCSTGAIEAWLAGRRAPLPAYRRAILRLYLAIPRPAARDSKGGPR